MPLTQALLILLASAIVLPAVGYPLVAASLSASSPRRILWAFPVGLAVVILAARSAVSLAPMHAAMPYLWAGLALWVAAHWGRASLRSKFAADLSRVRPRSVALIALLLLITAWTTVFPLGHHGAILFEGSPNHDSIYYVVNARWLLDHTVGEPLAYTPASPLMSMSFMFFGPHARLGRLGSESLLAFIAASLRKDPVYLYHGGQALVMAVAAITAIGTLPRAVLEEISRTSVRGIAAAVAVSLAPQTLQMAVNSNYASAYGTVLFTTAIAMWFMARERWLNYGLLVAAGALIASYPEQMPIAAGVAGAICLVAWATRQRRFVQATEDGVRFGVSVLIAALLLPWIAGPALWVLKSAYFEISSDTSAWPAPYSPLRGLRYAVAYLTTASTAATHVPRRALIPAICIIAASFLLVRRSTKDNLMAWGVMLGFTVLTILMFAVHYNYGKLKIVEYFALLLTPAAVMLAFQARAITEQRWRHHLSTAAILVLACTNVYATASICQDSSYWGQRKRVTTDLVELAGKTSAIARTDAIAVRFMENSYFYSMWFAYFASAPVDFAPGYGAGGYIQTYAKEYPYSPFDSAPIAVGETRTLEHQVSPMKTIVRQGSYSALDVSQSTSMNIEGGYSPESDWFWMGPEMKLNIKGQSAESVRISLRNRYAPVSDAERVAVLLDGQACEATVPTDGGDLQLELKPGPSHTVTITPKGPVQSPAQFEQSADLRPLSYRVTGIELNADTDSNDLTCVPI